MDRKKLFNLIKPYSVAVMENFSLHNLQQYKTQLQILLQELIAMDNFVEYLCFPLIMSMKQRLKESGYVLPFHYSFHLYQGILYFV